MSRPQQNVGKSPEDARVDPHETAVTHFAFPVFRALARGPVGFNGSGTDVAWREGDGFERRYAMELTALELPASIALAPDCRLALKHLCDRLKKHGELAALAGILEWWGALGSEVRDPRRAVGALYARLSQSAEGDAALALAISALDLVPGNAEALTVFERSARVVDPGMLRDRYDAFLRHAPFHASAPRIRQRLIDLLVDEGNYEGALQHVNYMAPRPTVPVFPADEIASACSIAPLPTWNVREEQSRSHACDEQYGDESSDATVVLDLTDIEVVLAAPKNQVEAA